MRILVTGGAGYIGSHAAQFLVGAGHEVTILDSLSRGHLAAVDRLSASLDDEARGRLAFEQADIADTERVRSILTARGIEAVMHFAALAYVGESVTDPLTYHDNNTGAAVHLLRACDQAGVQRFVFSSTCATYGEPEIVPITENEKQRPINPYGWSKLHTERVLIDYAEAAKIEDKPFAFAGLRYFNVAGADPSGVLGEWHKPETHLIPIVIEAALGKREHVTIFGTDYDTPDGTCIRDYIHVVDLAAAHLAVLERLEQGQQRFYNLGIGNGYSVREVIEAAERVTGKKIPVKEGQRRAGDPPALFADASRIKSEIGWAAERPELEGMIESAWKWYEANPNGYDA